MAIDLEAISFRAAGGAPPSGAMAVRRNASAPLPTPEWQRGVSVDHDDSLAAYSLGAARSQTLTIQARFRRSDGELESAEIQAVPELPPPEPPDWWLAAQLAPLLPWPALYAYYAWVYRELWRLQAAPSARVLGEVAPRTVAFAADGDTGFQTFELANTGLDSRGVGVNDITWHWQFRLAAADPWQDFAESKHRVYSVVATPTKPWTQSPSDPSNTQLPWTDVLEFACRWATGATDVDAAATAVTRAVSALGGTVIEYGCPVAAASEYSYPLFNCTAFLDRLRGGVGNGRYVNCSDCAAIVSTFANALGCNLWQSKMYGARAFALNSIRSIGSNIWQIACGWGGFNYHEVAWKDACTATDAVFDACVILDGDADPTLDPHTPLLPTNLVFGAVGSGAYRDRLAAPAGRADCEPQPLTRQRRPVV